MRTATPLFASCALLFSISAVAQVPPNPVNCKKSEKPGENLCDVTIIVPAACGGGIHVAPDPIVVENKDVKITWTIRSSGDWIFAGAKGIEIHAGADKAFGNTVRESDTVTTATRVPSKSGPRMYKYDINLARKSSKDTCRHDPTVVNQ